MDAAMTIAPAGKARQRAARARMPLAAPDTVPPPSITIEIEMDDDSAEASASPLNAAAPHGTETLTEGAGPPHGRLLVVLALLAAIAGLVATWAATG
jgi:hypothetical protein